MADVIHRVRAPDGTIHRIKAPEDASPESLLAVVQQNYQPPQMQMIGREGLAGDIRSTAQGANYWDQFWAGVGTAPQLALEGIRSFWGGRDQANTDEQQALARATPMTMGGNIAGNVLQTAPIPAGAIGAGARAAGAAPVAKALASRPGVVGDVALTAGTLAAVTEPGDAGEKAKAALMSAGMAGAIPLSVAGGQGVRRMVTKEGQGLRISENLASELGPDGTRRLLTELHQPYVNAPVGTKPTAAMLTQNPTLQALELGARVRRPDLFANLDDANSLARWNALQSVAKDDAALNAAKGARTGASEPVKQEALTLAAGQPEDAMVLPLMAKLDELKTGATRPNKAVQAMVSYVSDELQKGVTPEQLYTIRKSLTSDIPRGTELGAAMGMARAERVALVKALDEGMNSVTGGKWSDYLKAYQDASPPITSMTAGQKIAGAFESSPNRTSSTFGSVPVLTPGKLSRQIEVHGSKELGSQTFDRLLPDDRKMLEAVVDDLIRQQDVMKAKGLVGSDTAAKIAAGNRADDVAQLATEAALNKAVPMVGGMLGSSLFSSAARKREEMLAEILKDPKMLEEALRRARIARGLLMGATESARGTRVGEQFVDQ